MSLETPMGKFLGHGSARDGTGHWWAQKLTAIALVPLALWFVLSLLGMDSFAHADVTAWIGKPLNAILLILLTLSSLYHSELGLQVVVEDYVHGAAKVVTLVIFKLLHAALAVAAVYAIVIISLSAMTSGVAG